MAIVNLTREEAELLATLQPRPFTDAAYRLRPNIDCWLMTPHRLIQMYGLDNVTERQLRDLVDNRFRDSRYLILMDLGNIQLLQSTTERIRQFVVSQPFSDDVRGDFNDVMQQFSEERVLQEPDGWYGYPMLANNRAAGYDYVTGIKTIYPRLAEANLFFDRFEAQLAIDPETDVPRPKMLFTSRALGVFSFAKFSTTMYSLPCFKTDESDDKCIPVMQIQKRDDKYFLGEGDVEVKKYGFELRDDGKRKVRTLTKKVYAYKENRIKITPYINIYVCITANGGVRADDYRWNSFAAIALARILTTAGFKISITTLDISADSLQFATNDYAFDNDDNTRDIVNNQGIHDNYTITRFLTKNYDELLDYNLALIYGGDPAFFRYDTFKAYVYANYAWHSRADSSFGSAVDNELQIETLLDRYNICNLENETRVVISGRYSEVAASDAVRSKLAELRILYGR
jgi:hypothetical protein